LRVKGYTYIFVAAPRNIARAALARRPLPLARLQTLIPAARIGHTPPPPSLPPRQGLAVAEAEGRLPPPPEGAVLPGGRTNAFDPDELDEYWSRRLDYSLLGGPDPDLVGALGRVSRDWNVEVVAFSNGPRRYVLRVLEEIGLLGGVFPPGRVFGVTDVLPHCKPDVGSFRRVLGCIGARPEETVMVEDSMKNVRAAKALGMRTILVVGRGRSGRRRRRRGEGAWPAAVDAEAGADDAPDETDPAVDASVEVASEVVDVLEAWLGP
jgi:FMN phosphatase YigB (HAD superfamily)